MEQYKSAKAQVFSMDVLVATSVVLMITGMFFLYWDASISEINVRQGRKDMQRAAFDAADYLVKVKVVDRANIFNPNKLVNFTSTFYTEGRTELGLDGYEFYFNLTYPNGVLVSLNGTQIVYGDYFPVNASDVLTSRRIGVLQNQKVVLTLYVWR